MPKEKLKDCKGVTFDKRRGVWNVRIIFNNKSHSCGSYKDREDARKVWRDKINQFYGTDLVESLYDETWICMKDHNPDYYISNKGRVKNTNFKGLGVERLLGQSNSHGYRDVKVNRKTYRVHKIVAYYFLGKSTLAVNHIDMNRANNCVENLEYVTLRSNICHGRAMSWGKDHLVGAHYSKCDNKWRSEIGINGKMISLGFFNNQQEASDRYVEALLEYGLVDDYNYIKGLLEKQV